MLCRTPSSVGDGRMPRQYRSSYAPYMRLSSASSNLIRRPSPKAERTKVGSPVVITVDFPTPGPPSSVTPCVGAFLGYHPQRDGRVASNQTWPLDQPLR